MRFGGARAILQPQEEKEANKKAGRTKRQENQGPWTSFEPQLSQAPGPSPIFVRGANKPSAFLSSPKESQLTF